MLYSLAGNVLALLKTKRDEYFTHLPASQKNMSNTIHYIGKVIASHRMSCAHSDGHSFGVGAGLLDLINNSENVYIQRFYNLSQQILLEILFEKYEVEGEKKNVTTDNKIRNAGIIFCL